jgi:putative transposase
MSDSLLRASSARNAAGGRSSATLQAATTGRGTTIQSETGSRSSPLQDLRARQPQRKRPAHFPPIETGFQSVIVFLTVCVNQRRPLLANERAARLIVEAWQASTFWRVGRYVIMPDHIHLFCAPNTHPAHSLKKWIECWKNHVTREWTNRSQVPIWQREFWDRQLRRVESYDEKWEYIKNNPVRHGFVSRGEDWPYQGELNVLEWHDR